MFWPRECIHCEMLGPEKPFKNMHGREKAVEHCLGLVGARILTSVAPKGLRSTGVATRVHTFQKGVAPKGLWSIVWATWMYAL